MYTNNGRKFFMVSQPQVQYWDNTTRLYLRLFSCDIPLVNGYARQFKILQYLLKVAEIT